MSDVKLGVGADVSKADRALEQLKQRVQQIAGASEEVGQKLNDSISFLASQQVFSALESQIESFVGKFEEAEKAGNSLRQSLITQGIYTKELEERYQAIGKAIQAKTLIDGDEIVKGEAVIQGYLGQIEVTDELAGRIADFAALHEIDLVQAFDLVGKSVGSQTNALSRYGIEVDVNASKQEKLRQIIDKFTATALGQAEAQAAGTGVVKQAALAFEDLQETVGEQLAPAVETVAGLMKSFFETLSESPRLAELAGYLTLGATGAAALATAITGAALVWGPFTTGVKAGTAALQASAAFLAANPIILGLAALAAAAAGLYIAWEKNLGGIQEITAGAWAATKAIVGEIADAWSGLAEIQLGVLTLDSDRIKRGYERIKSVILGSIDRVRGAYQDAHDKRLAEIEEERQREAAKNDDAEKAANAAAAAAAARERQKGTLTKQQQAAGQKAREIAERNTEQALSNQIERLGQVGVKEAKNADAARQAYAEQLELAKNLYQAQVTYIEKTKGKTAEAQALKTEAEIKYNRLREELGRQVAEKLRDLGSAEYTQRKQELDSALRDETNQINERASLEIKSEKDIREIQKDRLELAEKNYNDQIALIDKTLKGTKDEAQARQKALDDYNEARRKADQEATDFRKKNLDAEQERAKAGIQAGFAEGLKGAAGIGAAILGAQLAGPLGEEVAGQLFNALSQDQDKFKEYFASLFDTKFVENIVANAGYATSKIFLDPKFQANIIAGIARGIRDGALAAARDVGDSIGDVFSGASFTGRNKLSDLRSDYARVTADIESLEQEKAELVKKANIESLQQQVDGQQSILDKASKAREDLERQLSDAVEKQRDQANKRLLDQLQDRLDEEQQKYTEAKDARVALERQLADLLDKQATQRKSDAQKAVDDETRDQKRLYDRASGERERIQQEIVETQDDIQYAHNDAEKSELQEHLTELNEQYQEWNERFLDAQEAYNKADSAARRQHGVETEKTVDQQIADVKAKLDQARAEEASAAEVAAAAKTALAKQQATNEEVITDDKIAAIKAKLDQSVKDEAAARETLTGFTAELSKLEVTARDELAQKEEEINEKLREQQRLREGIEKGENSPSEQINKYRDKYTPKTGNSEVDKGIERARDAYFPGVSANLGLTNLDFGVPRSFADYRVASASAAAPASNAYDLAGLLKGLTVPGDGKNEVTIRLVGDDDFGKLVARSLTRGTALGIGNVRVVNGSED